MLELAICAVVGFSVGWFVHGWRRRTAFRTHQERWQHQVDQLQGSLALEKLRIDTYIRTHPDEIAKREEAPRLELHREAKLARPNGRKSDSSAARA